MFVECIVWGVMVHNAVGNKTSTHTYTHTQKLSSTHTKTHSQTLPNNIKRVSSIIYERAKAKTRKHATQLQRQIALAHNTT